MCVVGEMCVCGVCVCGGGRCVYVVGGEVRETQGERGTRFMGEGIGAPGSLPQLSPSPPPAPPTLSLATPRSSPNSLPHLEGHVVDGGCAELFGKVFALVRRTLQGGGK